MVKALRNMPQDAPVVIGGGDHTYIEVHHARQRKATGERATRRDGPITVARGWRTGTLAEHPGDGHVADEVEVLVVVVS